MIGTWPGCLGARGRAANAAESQVETRRLVDKLWSYCNVLRDEGVSTIAFNLSRLINDLIERETWSIHGTDVNGDAYEQLLSRGAADTKSGAGQYFTPRPLINAMVRCARPTPQDTITDPACGTGGFLLAHRRPVRRALLRDYDVHTLLRLPTGIFYAGGVKANVLFFDAKPPAGADQPLTEKLAVYDFRTNQHFTLKKKALRDEHLDDFVDWYLSADRPEDRKPNERVKLFDYAELVARDKVNLDLIGWVKDESADDADELLAPEVIAAEIVEDLQAALSEFAAVAQALGGSASED